MRPLRPALALALLLVVAGCDDKSEDPRPADPPAAGPTEQGSATSGAAGATDPSGKAGADVDGEALYAAGKTALEAGEYKEAQRNFTLACNAKHYGACVESGNLRASGKSTDGKRAPDLAFRLYDKACKGGNGSGCYNLGQVYLDGDGVTPDPTQAAEAFAKACHADVGRGCVALGISYMAGSGVAKDPKRGVELLSEPCNEHGDVEACYSLAIAHYQGQGVAQDVARAFQLAQLSCTGNHGGGCHMVGLLFEKGVGMKADLARARTFFDRGCKLRFPPACESLEGLAAGGGK